jgi:hypothetical protein
MGFPIVLLCRLSTSDCATLSVICHRTRTNTRITFIHCLLHRIAIVQPFADPQLHVPFAAVVERQVVHVGGWACANKSWQEELRRSDDATRANVRHTRVLRAAPSAGQLGEARLLGSARPLDERKRTLRQAKLTLIAQRRIEQEACPMRGSSVAEPA